ncbi:MAG: N-acetyltransferase [Herbinix sp.]|nr:N-acetyltransferase [Herbinix sp.]
MRHTLNGGVIMLKLQGNDIYLAVMERKDCIRIWNDFEYDFDHPTEPLNIGHSEEKADQWFDDIQKNQGAKTGNRSKGYGKQAVKLMLHYGFYYMGLERITANTLEINTAAQKSLEQTGFVLEGVERKAIFMNCNRYSRLNYAILKEDYQK